MRPLEITAFDVAERFIGVTEVPGQKDNPLILAMLQKDQAWPKNDETPWCSAFVNWIAWVLRLPRSKSLLARSWLGVGRPVDLEHAEVGFDVVILKRGSGPQPGAHNRTAPGHVGFYAGQGAVYVYLLGGNQGNEVSVARYAISRVLGVRRLFGQYA
jgi:uncharacterized protein (TIGR02594 family)